MSVFSPCSCYEVRRDSATVKIQVIDDTEEPPPSLEVVVCTRYPCRKKPVCRIALLDVVLCFFVLLLQICLNEYAQATARTRFNKNAKVVLKAISKTNMKIKKWKPKSKASKEGADIAPKPSKGKNPPKTVTVTLLEAIPEFARQSDPYTFTVTAKFDDGRTNKASTTLYINYVRL